MSQLKIQNFLAFMFFFILQNFLALCFFHSPDCYQLSMNLISLLLLLLVLLAVFSTESASSPCGRRRCKTTEVLQALKERVLWHSRREYCGSSGLFTVAENTMLHCMADVNITFLYGQSSTCIQYKFAMFSPGPLRSCHWWRKSSTRFHTNRK